MGLRNRQAGAALGEVLLLLLVMLIFIAQAVPTACKFYRQAAVEYEAEQLLAAIRYCQNMSRVTAESAWGYGAKEAGRHYVFLQLFPEYQQIVGGSRDIISCHRYLPGIQAVKIHREQGKNIYDSTAELIFSANGKPKSVSYMMTILIYYQGYPQEGQRIMVSKGGRIRMERGGIEQ
ncbi:MAG: hypothetical protein K6F95_07170 [Selenomonas sp.]|uniref:hypothetical protein n=1 Tax=Selenomonas sp. TaxID=2053611 RepID=UPI0025DE9C90|nr:hypothetical protein [Selenomonas sp.]MCR5757671.1 hypothetical protein [Selenomonas sp.]